MLAVTDQPDGQRGAGRPDPDVEGSRWLASALSGMRRGEQRSPDASRDQPDEPPASGGSASGAPASSTSASTAGTPTAGQPTAATPAAAASTAVTTPGTVQPAASSAGSATDTPAATASRPTGAHRPPPEHALSPLGAPPLPTTPTGVVRWWTAGATLAAAILLSVAAFAGTTVLVVAALFVVGVTAWGWPRLIDSPSPRGSATVVAAGGAASALAVGLTEQEPLLQWLALALAGAVVLEFVHQLARRDGRPRLVECVTATLAGVVVLASMSSWIALPRTDTGAGGVLVAAVPVAVALAMQAAPVPARMASVAGVVASTVLGGLIAGFVPEPTVLAGLVTGLLASAVGVMVHRLLTVLPPAGAAPAWLALAMAPLASTGMVSYVTLRLMVG